MSVLDRLRAWTCGRAQDRRRVEEDDDAAELIADAEATRRELAAITARLTAHVAALQALTRAQVRRQEGEARSG